MERIYVPEETRIASAYAKSEAQVAKEAAKEKNWAGFETEELDVKCIVTFGFRVVFGNGWNEDSTNFVGGIGLGSGWDSIYDVATHQHLNLPLPLYLSVIRTIPFSPDDFPDRV